ncbi:MAG: 2-succinyl-5-enolpyruvyl-6-hydroxy-3-cyclohexene-1-carboxylic-acid synthase [Candidatus Marinimicrobia bacterium]|nr:2-succinyl-5-enolpyruvyl-6-hydroxy-3-cyclohexene-1-carboxylic-acid synthase [Candidatus Neomarinimicrobiota bacterium]MDP6611177.1 2-succinyl-5-enolpyruvyl-6-hydroxy-3-cyclohexene-1-carboxylic-acid synthase [Candidatus Neomarinimicrobiota bacterium]
MALQNTRHIYDLIGLCAEFGVEKAVVCPGSRCAPLLIGFGKYPKIETISVTDERTAGFVTLGLAQQSDKPVVLVCTSGTAAQNFAPAVTEAFYQNVPLIVLTADRPPEWIDQWDGQTIHQRNLYVDHVKDNFIYDEENVDVAEKAFELALDGTKGPVHLNIPIREPFYPDSIDEVNFTTEIWSTRRKNKINKIDKSVWDEFELVLKSSEKVMVLGGQMEPNQELVNVLNQLGIPVVGDVISNLHRVDGVIKSPDLLFKNADNSLSPDLLITFGRSVISKNLKLFLRANKPKVHWHIGLGMVGDPFQSLTKIIEIEPVEFLKEWVNKFAAVSQSALTDREKDDSYFNLLSKAQIEVDENLISILRSAKFNYFSAVQKVIAQLLENSVLHLGNSMPVRIANFIGVNEQTVDVWCNRGTSGIDGVVSSAVGHALGEPDKKHTLIVGDLSFFYDRNGLWLNHTFPSNLQIIILNDSGGGIFNMIPGPSNQNGLTDLFTTPHERTAELTAKEFGLAYTSAASLEAIHEWEAGILEIFTDMKTNTETFKRITKKI